MKSFIKHSLKGIVFAAGFLFLLIVASQIVVPKNNIPKSGMRHTSANGILSEPENTIDILVLGDSESYRSIIPMKLWEDHGFTSYCCGSPAQRLFESEDFLDKATQNQSPKLILLETDVLFRDYSYDDMLMYESGLVLPVIEYHNRWKTLTPNDYKNKINYTYTDVRKGYQFKVTSKAGTKKDYMKKSKATVPILQQNINHLKRIKKYCDEHDIRLVLITTPCMKSWNYKRHNSVAKLAKEMKLEYIDTNTRKKDVPIDWKTDSYDKGEHMNHFGAEKVTEFLGKWLEDKGYAQSHKDDPKYSYWDDQLDIFNKELAKVLDDPSLELAGELEE